MLELRYKATKASNCLLIASSYMRIFAISPLAVSRTAEVAVPACLQSCLFGRSPWPSLCCLRNNTCSCSCLLTLVALDLTLPLAGALSNSHIWPCCILCLRQSVALKPCGRVDRQSNDDVAALTETSDGGSAGCKLSRSELAYPASSGPASPAASCSNVTTSSLSGAPRSILNSYRSQAALCFRSRKLVVDPGVPK